MSDFFRPAYHPATNTVRDAHWMDDYHGRHQYGVRFSGDDEVYRPEDVDIPRGVVFVPEERVRELEAALRMIYSFAYGDDAHGFDDDEALERIRVIAYKALES